MKVLFKLLWILLIAGILEACNASGRLEYALECAATNKGELEKVLEHYKDEPEKYKAACFLIVKWQLCKIMIHWLYKLI